MEKEYLMNLKRIRIEKGISQKQMADRLGFAQSNFNKIENGISELTVNRLFEIAQILDVPVIEILGFGEVSKNQEVTSLKERIKELELQIEEVNLFSEKIALLFSKINSSANKESPEKTQNQKEFEEFVKSKSKKGTTDSQINQ